MQQNSWLPGNELDVLHLRHGGDAVNHRVREGRVRLHPLPQLEAHVARHLQHHVLDLHHRAGVSQAGDREGAGGEGVVIQAAGGISGVLTKWGVGGGKPSVYD